MMDEFNDEMEDLHELTDALQTKLALSNDETDEQVLCFHSLLYHFLSMSFVHLSLFVSLFLYYFLTPSFDFWDQDLNDELAALLEQQMEQTVAPLDSLSITGPSLPLAPTADLFILNSAPVRTMMTEL